MKLKTTFFLFVMPLIAFLQTIIKGTVSDEIGPLSGASIIIKNTRIGTVSDINGKYEIEAKKGDTLLVSYLGYDTDYVLVANKESANIVLSGRVILNEVHVLAYGSRHICRTICCGFITSYNYDKNFKSDIITEKLYPNPSRNGIFQLKLLNDYKKVQIHVSSMSGKLIKIEESKPTPKNISIDLSSFPSGIYIINIIADGKRLSAKKAIIG